MKEGMMFNVKSGMRVDFIGVLVLALTLTACPNPGGEGGNDDPPPNTKTTLKINNLSGYTLPSVEYAGVSFGDIRSGSIAEQEVPAGTQSLFFTGKSANGDQRIKLRDVVICEENKNTEVTINDNSVIVLVESENTDTLKIIFDTMFTTPFEGTWINIGAKENINLLFINGNTIEGVGYGRWDQKGAFTYTDSKIVFEFQSYYNGARWEYYPIPWTEDWPYNPEKTQITWFNVIYKKIPIGTAVLMNKLSELEKNPASVLIELTQDEIISPVRLDYGRDLTVTIKSSGG
jgi:hypothetical protein